MFSSAQRKARKLLNKLITPDQWQQFILDGYFTQEDGKRRTWKFLEREHYPIECEGYGICIDPERGAPNEDLLSQIWLEVIGGRSQELLPNIGLHYNFIIQDDVCGTAYYSSQTFHNYTTCVFSTSWNLTENPECHGALHGITE